MSETTIEWTRGPNGEQGYSFNPWVGCEPISPACAHCYAQAWAKRAGHPELWEGERRRTSAANWKQPLKWNREAAAAGERRRVFCASLADVFDNQVPPAWRADLFDLIRKTPHLDWLLLTKRIGNAERMIKGALFDGDLLSPESMWPWPNVWIGATICNQEEAERDIPKLLTTEARIRFLSIEPMLGPIDLRCLDYDSGDQLPEPMRVNDGRCSLNALRGITAWPGSHYQSPTIKRDVRIVDGKVYQSQGEGRRIDWVIAGGESGSKARPTHPQWARALRDQCVAAAVPFFWKQWGAFLPSDQPDARRFNYDEHSCHDWGDGIDSIRLHKKDAGRLLDGIEHNNSPGAQS